MNCLENIKNPFGNGDVIKQRWDLMNFLNNGYAVSISATYTAKKANPELLHSKFKTELSSSDFDVLFPSSIVIADIDEFFEKLKRQGLTKIKIKAKLEPLYEDERKMIMDLHKELNNEMKIIQNKKDVLSRASYMLRRNERDELDDKGIEELREMFGKEFLNKK